MVVDTSVDLTGRCWAINNAHRMLNSSSIPRWEWGMRHSKLSPTLCADKCSKSKLGCKMSRVSVQKQVKVKRRTDKVEGVMMRIRTDPGFIWSIFCSRRKIRIEVY